VQTYRPERVLITGASSGIGAALALACARPGATLHLGGRDAERLAASAERCAAAGASVHAATIDVRDAAAMAGWIGGAGRLDLVVANAGISAGTGIGTAETAAQIRAIFATNLDGVFNTVLPAMTTMAAQDADAAGVRGRIAVVASVAALLAHPGAPSYCAAKAAVDRWTVASTPTARQQGIRLTSLCPGFIRTRMTAGNQFPMPGLMDAEAAAAIMLRAIAAGRVRAAFPWWIALGARAMAALPAPLGLRILATRTGKAAEGSL
jgi:NAD(P)-dependent dehydrogenase (short-subunit alcohol dehydrogenase family)